MPNGDAWDWPMLLYVGTVLLNRSERQFWRMTPRKLNALTEAHIELKKGSSNKEETMFIDQAF